MKMFKIYRENFNMKVHQKSWTKKKVGVFFGFFFFKVYCAKLHCKAGGRHTLFGMKSNTDMNKTEHILFFPGKARQYANRSRSSPLNLKIEKQNHNFWNLQELLYRKIKVLKRGLMVLCSGFRHGQEDGGTEWSSEDPRIHLVSQGWRWPTDSQLSLAGFPRRQGQ